jgi:hypothetical protein
MLIFSINRLQKGVFAPIRNVKCERLRGAPAIDHNDGKIAAIWGDQRDVDYLLREKYIYVY